MDLSFAYTGIRVRDLDLSLRFYTKVLDMKEILRGTMSHGGIYVHLKGPGSSQRLELNWYPKGNRFARPYRNGEELDHLGFRTRDVVATYRRLLRGGAKAAVPPWREDGYEIAFVSDPDGVWIELLGPAKKRRKVTRAR